MYNPLWQADGKRIRRVAPMEFIGRYLSDWFDYGIGDEVHQLTAGDTAQGNALGTLAACTDRLVVLTGTLLSGYADDLYHLLFRLEAGKMVGLGYEWGKRVCDPSPKRMGCWRKSPRSSQPTMPAPRRA